MSQHPIQQITTESAKSSLTSLDLRANYHNETKKMTKDRDGAAQAPEGADKVGGDSKRTVWYNI